MLLTAGKRRKLRALITPGTGLHGGNTMYRLLSKLSALFVRLSPPAANSADVDPYAREFAAAERRAHPYFRLA